MSPWKHGMLGYGKIAGKYSVELPRLLRDAGYFTFGIGKMHYDPQRNLHGFHGTLLEESGRVESIGFLSDYRKWLKATAPNLNPDATGIGWNDNRFKDFALDEFYHPTAWTGRTAVEFISNYTQEKPLFLKVSFARPHSPYDAPARLVNQYHWEDMPAPIIGEWAHENKTIKIPDSPAMGDFGEDFAKRARRHYYANITFIDEWIGKIVQILKKRGLYENSVILFTSDHGDMLGDHFFWRKTYAYEGSSHIPFILRWPSSFQSMIPRGSKMHQLVEIRDILPTFLEFADQKIPVQVDGLSLLPLITTSSASWREILDLEHATAYWNGNYWMALRDIQYKYIYFRSTGKEQLFNLKQDPHELVNLVDNPQYSKILQEWRNRMVDHLKIRGTAWVKKGVLQIQRKAQLYSPHYPSSGWSSIIKRK
jgi:arylsulfatase A-like enzyme